MLTLRVPIGIQLSASGNLTPGLADVISSERSKVVTHLLMRNELGSVMLYAGLFERRPPPAVGQAAKQLHDMLANNELDLVAGRRYARNSRFGDLQRLLRPEAESALDDMTFGLLAARPPCGALAVSLDDFFRGFLFAHVISPTSWEEADTAMVLLILFSYRDFEPVLHERYGWALGSGVVANLQRYRLLQQAIPLDPTQRDFDFALIFSILKHVARG